MTTPLRPEIMGSGLVLACCLLAAPAHSQWSPCGVPLTQGPGGQDQPRIASDGTGGAIVVWRDERDRFARNADVYTQRVTVDGLIAPGWLADGTPACIDSASQDGSRVGPDGAGGAYVVWMDWRDYFRNGHRSDLYMQRLTPGGSIASGWAIDGNVVSAEPSDQWLPTLAADGAFVVWEDFRRGSNPSDRTQTDLYAQRITGDGEVAAGWPVDGLVVCTAQGDRGAVVVMSDEAGGLFICWTDRRDLTTSGADIYALRITEEGAVVRGWVADGVPVCTAPGDQTSQGLFDLVPDGQGGFIVAWVDYRNAPPGDPFFYADIYAQRVTASGDIAPGWPENGWPSAPQPTSSGITRRYPTARGEQSWRG